MENKEGVRCQWRPSSADQGKRIDPSLSSDDDENNSGSTISDCESGISGCSSVFSGDGSMIRLREDDKFHGLIRRRLVAGLGPEVGAKTTIEAIHRNSHSSLVGRARLAAFRIFERAMAEKSGGDANVRYAWFSTSSADEVSKIFSHGFARIRDNRSSHNNGGSYGQGLYLFPDGSLIQWYVSCSKP